MRVPTRYLLLGGAVYCGTASASYIYLRGAGPCCEDSPATPGPCNVFDRIAGDYDAKINLDETLMGIGLMRRWLVRQAGGDVLEVSCGTGRNLPYYLHTANMTSLTLSDASRPMLAQAFDKHRSAAAAEGGLGVPLRFCLADAEQLCSGSRSSGSSGGTAAAAGKAAAAEGDAPFSESSTTAQAPRFGPALTQTQHFLPGSFDTVIDTFGLCSCRDPVKALQEMVKALRPGGRLLLLEHGRSSWGFVNGILDSHAAQHYGKWGCQWNREIEALVQQAGLEIETLRRWHFGTTYLIVARPAPAPAQPQL